MSNSEPCELNFRQLFSTTTAMLIQRFGVRHWPAIEDAVQNALLEASGAWARETPRNSGAWVYRVAHRRFVDELRRDAVAARAYSVIARTDHQCADDVPEEVIRDGTLRMLFTCCSPQLAPDASVALALKTVCGFGIRELAAAFLVSPEAIKKRLQRARQTLVEADFNAELTPDAMTFERLQSVQQVVYLIFNEGYFSSVDDEPIREDLCGEGIRLASLLVHDPRTATPQSHALCALLLFHAARHSQRRDAGGLPVRLADQDRSAWDSQLITLAQHHLDQATGDGLANSTSALNLEAAIAREHCVAPEFSATNWSLIVHYYDFLRKLRPDPEVQLARVIAVSFLDGPRVGVQSLLALKAEQPSLHDTNYFAALADCYVRLGDHVHARAAFANAFELAQTNWQREWINRLAAQVPK